MGRPTYRKTADVLRKTIQQLEADPTVDTQATAFVDLKCALLHRIIELETGKAQTEARIHLVDSAVADEGDVGCSESAEEQDSAIA